MRGGEDIQYSLLRSEVVVNIIRNSRSGRSLVARVRGESQVGEEGFIRIW